MTTIEQIGRRGTSIGDRWRLFVAMLVYAGAVSAYSTLSLSFAVRDAGTSFPPGSSADILFIVVTFASIVAYAIGFAVLAGLLDVWTGRRPQPLAALNLALPVLATFELIKVPLLRAVFQIWFAATR
jgi:hypothetical protein